MQFAVPPRLSESTVADPARVTVAPLRSIFKASAAEGADINDQLIDANQSPVALLAPRHVRSAATVIAGKYASHHAHAMKTAHRQASCGKAIDRLRA